MWLTQFHLLSMETPRYPVQTYSIPTLGCLFGYLEPLLYLDKVTGQKIKVVI